MERPKTRRVVGTVSVLIQMFEVVHLETEEGRTLSIGVDTPGVDWRTLREGQRVQCDVSGEHWSRVEFAQLLDDGGAASAAQPDTRCDRATVRRVVATVSVLVPEFELVKLEIGDGDSLTIGRRTLGVDWRELRVGQRLLCTVTGVHAVRVEEAQLLE